MQMNATQSIQSIPMITISDETAADDSKNIKTENGTDENDELETEQQILEMMNTDTVSIKTEMFQSGKKNSFCNEII